MGTYQAQANLLKVMAHPMRLRMLDILCRDSECVCHLSTALDRPQPYVSQQLAILRRAGLVNDEKTGTNVFYRLADERIARQMAALLGPPAGAGASESAPPREAIAGCVCPKCRGVDCSSPC
jgi:DNA-binding transcriptional ArsR family regulator